MVQKQIGPLQDAQRAIQMVREEAKNWNIDPNGIGIAGFSAGGHLASTLGTHYRKALIANPEQTSFRPDFMLLVYPVISMKEGRTHKGSQVNLLGNSPSQEQLTLFSNEEQVTGDTPPTFLIHAKDDGAVPIENSLLFKKSLELHHVPVELLVYPKGGHGFGLNNPTSKDQWFPHVAKWVSDL
jgi:acetyl esterase/lipase